MALLRQKIVKEDIEVGIGTVERIADDGSTLIGTRNNLDADRLTMHGYYQGSDTWQFIKPDGSALNTGGTQTGGLQEAINAVAANGWNFNIPGGSQATTIPRFILNATLNIPILYGVTWRIGYVVVDIAASVSGPGIVFDSALLADLDLGWNVHHLGTGPVMRIKPTNVIVNEGTALFSSNRMRNFSLVSDDSTATMLELDAGTAGIGANIFSWDFIAGGAANPSKGVVMTATTQIANNLFQFGRLDKFRTTGLEMNGNSSTLFSNLITGVFSGNNAAAVNIDNYGANNTFIGIITGISGTGIRNQSGASGNIYMFSRNEATVAAVDQSGAGRNTYLLSNQFGIGATPNAKAVLDLSSTTDQGIRLPSMTTSQRNAISSPPENLFIWNTTTKKPNYFDGSSWVALP